MPRMLTWSTQCCTCPSCGQHHADTLVRKEGRCDCNARSHRTKSGHLHYRQLPGAVPWTTSGLATVCSGDACARLRFPKSWSVESHDHLWSGSSTFPVRLKKLWSARPFLTPSPGIPLEPRPHSSTSQDTQEQTKHARVGAWTGRLRWVFFSIKISLVNFCHPLSWMRRLVQQAHLLTKH